MPHIEVAADALQIEFFGIFLIIEMGGDTIVGDSLGKKILVAFYTRLIGNILHGIFQFRFFIPVNICCVLGQIAPYITHPQYELG